MNKKFGWLLTVIAVAGVVVWAYKNKERISKTCKEFFDEAKKEFNNEKVS